MNQLAFVFGLLGNIISFMVFLAPIPTFYKIYKKRSSEGFQCVPYLVGLFSAMMWIHYAFLKTDTTLLITINSFGCFIMSLYLGFYIFFAPKADRVKTVKLLLMLNVVGLGVIILLTHFWVKTSHRASVVGWICLVFSLCVFIAPLCVVGKVMRTKSVEFMPFLPSLFLTISAVMWFFYGLLLKDYNIAIPNVLGFGFGVVQMVLYFMYRKNKKVLEPSDIEIQAFDEQKLPELQEQILDVLKLSNTTIAVEIIPVVPLPIIIENCSIEVEMVKLDPNCVDEVPEKHVAGNKNIHVNLPNAQVVA